MPTIDYGGMGVGDGDGGDVGTSYVGKGYGIDGYEIPKKIDYLSIHVEASAYDILRSFPFDLISVDLITVEYNFEVNKRQKIRAFLESRGFEKVTDIDTKWDDWFQSVQKKK